MKSLWDSSNQGGELTAENKSIYFQPEKSVPGSASAEGCGKQSLSVSFFAFLASLRFNCFLYEVFMGRLKAGLGLMDENEIGCFQT